MSKAEFLSVLESVDGSRNLVVQPVDFLRQPGKKQGKNQDGDLLEELVTDLQEYVVVDGSSLCLIPVQTKWLEAELAFTRAWQNEELRRGYLPILPRNYSDTCRVVNGWRDSSKKLSYVYYRDDETREFPTIDGYLKFEFSYTDELKDKIMAWVTYEILNIERQSRGITTRALALGIKFLTEMGTQSDTPLVKLQTGVNEDNIGSVRILAANRFQLDQEKGIEPKISQTGFKGDVYQMVRYLL